MKKTLTTLVILFFSFSAAAQNSVRVNVVIPAPYPDYLSYYREPGRMVITLQNMTNTQQEVYLRASIKGIDNSREIVTKPEFRPSRPIVIPAGVGQTVTVSSTEIMELYKPANLNFYNTDQTRISASDRVGEGTYLICVRAYDYRSATRALSADQMGCTTVLMRNLEAPMLIQPAQDQVITQPGTQNVIFSWTRPAGAPMGTRYILKIVEIFTPERNANDAYLSSTAPPFFEKELTANVYVYGPADLPLVEGRRYAWAVTAIEPDRSVSATQSMFQNQGRSEIHAFTYKSSLPIAAKPVLNVPVITAPVIQEIKPSQPNITLAPMEAKSAPADVVLCECKSSAPSGQATGLAVNDQVKVGSFTLTVLGIEQQANGQFTGTGTIPVPLLNNDYVKIRVKFRHLEVVSMNGSKAMIAGTVKAMRRADMSLLPTGDAPNYDPAPLSTNDIHQIGAFLEGQQSQLISNIKSAANTLGYELPLGLDEGPITIGITEMNFSPTQAWFNAVASMEMPDGNTRAAFEMTGACMQATDFCGEFKMRLKEDFPVPALNMKLVAGNLQGDGTYIVFQKKFKTLSLAIDYTFHGGILDAATHQNATARLTAMSEEGWSQWIAQASLPDFYISGLPAITFSLGQKKIWYDHSDLHNPPALPASLKVGSETYTEIASKTWHGFYLPEISVNLPAPIKDIRRPDDKVTLSALNLIIDRNGFTGQVKNGTSPMLSIGNGSLSGWYASIDDISLLIYKSGFRESNMKGLVVLPGTGSATQSNNQLQYTSLLSYTSGPGLQYSFNILPKNNLKFDVLFATATIQDNSTIAVNYDATNGFVASTNLNGFISIANLVSAEKTPISLDLPQLELKNFKLLTKAPYWDKNGFYLGFASPQKKMAGFNFTLNKPSVDVTTLANNNVLAGLKFSGMIELIDAGFTCQAAASATIGSEFSWENQRIKWEGLGGKINEIKFAAGTTMGPFTLNGAIMYYNRQGDEGFVGAVESGVDGLFNVMMRARFGSTSDNQGNYKYFDFNALADFGSTGIPIAPPVPISFYGFGGGFYYNMRLNNANIIGNTQSKNLVDNAQTQAPPKNDSGPLALLNYNPAGLNLTPSRGGFGLQATVLLGLTNRNTLDADVTFSMSFSPTGAVEEVKLVGNARVLTDVSVALASRRSKSTGAGNLEILYNFQHKAFLMNSSAQMGVPYVDDKKWINVNGSMQLASDPGGWHFYIGQPPGYGNGPNTVKLLRTGGSSNASNYIFEGYSYFEVGSRIDPVPALPDDVIALVSGSDAEQTSKLKRPNETPGRGKYNAQKSGLIVGTHTNFKTEGEFLMFFGHLSSVTGFDIGITQGIDCVNYPSAGGPGGWYAMGQAYFGAKAKIGINVNLLLIKGKFTIFNAGAAAVLRAGLPNPTWVDGQIGGYFRILDGAVKGRFNFRVSVGEQCKVPGDPLAGLEIISEVTPASGPDLVPINSELTVLFNLEVGKVFVLEDMTTVDKDGNPLTRMFLFDSQCIDATVNNTNVPLINVGLGNEANLLYKVNPQYFNNGNSDYLVKNTNYNFKVVAYLKEASYSIKKGVPVVGPFKFVGKKVGELVETNANKSARSSQSMQTNFKTNEGFEHIPDSEYKSTLPIHGRKDMPYSYNRDFVIKVKKFISLEDNIKGVNPGATFVLRVYRNGVQVGTDRPLTIKQMTNDGKYTEINAGPLGVPLLPQSHYTCLLIAKNEVKSGTPSISAVESYGTLNRNLDANTLAQFQEVRLIKMKGNSRNFLRSGELIIGGYNFTTSKYATFEEKVNQLQFLSVNNGGPKDIISFSAPSSAGTLTPPVNNPLLLKQPILPGTPAVKTKQILDAWLPKDEQGRYVITVGKYLNFPVYAEFTGERFSKADLKDAEQNATKIPEINYGVLSPDWLQKIVRFLAEKANLPESQIYVARDISQHTVGTECSVSDDTYAHLVRQTNVGGKHPVVLPQPSDPIYVLQSLNLPNANLSSTLNLSFLGGYKVVEFQLGKSLIFCREYENLPATNIVQEIINTLINPVINPADQMGGFNTSQFNQASTWQNISSLVNSFGNGLNTKNMESQINSTLQR
jgi:hypothetical protein